MPIPLLDDLRGRGFRGEILAEAPLAPFTTWRIGGPAEVLATAAAPEDVELAVRFAVDRAIPWRVLGNGSNLLVRDEGVRGLVLRVRKALDGVAVDGGVIVAGAGASFPSVARAAAEHGLAGLEFGAGIPGTVGGAIVMNAGWHEFETGSRVAEVEFLEPDGLVVSYPARACRFGYRTSAFRTRRGVVLRAGFVLEPDEPLAVAARLEGFAAKRKESQPTELPSCGSVFLKPEGDFAGRLIEAAGLKGHRIGDVQVSPKHATFFVNLGRASAKDVLALVELVEAEVARTSGVKLVREFELW